MPNSDRGFAELIEDAVLSAIEKSASLREPTRRLVNAKEAGRFLSLSEREIHNMIAMKELSTVRHGRRLMLDVLDLERWIERNKR